ncbi:PREDICTED: small glutamine-rich tetratricopeptide repeat-containing protein-like [Fragaria vesca subsp. vesca]|uniref:small glutamine-rich tetratricopeptide repeat-containing protein-like n=1 Tax=Fragaria vesca subsp. vesca TaxID=101020 RepID=UPI0002C33D78|nr:PREDICTED: small glutamine-rich tetratricopeptide repeat-containing protein-like [Fragaria vesca subsp. vesca]
MAPPLTTDSPLSRRIVRSFLDFLSSVEPGAGVNGEGIQIARECLEEAFKLNTSLPADDNHRIKPGSLVEMFSSLEKNKGQENVTCHGQGSVAVPSASAAQDATGANVSKALKSLGQDSTGKQNELGESKDALFGRFFSALETARYFMPLPDGSDDPVKLEKATQVFHDALNEMERSGCEEFSPKFLAETLKSQGNKAMQSKLYTKAIELYDCAIALCENNAVYHCNRAAAYTQIHKYAEAIRDCLVSIEIDPNYSKAYSRLGLAFYAVGSYREAIDQGFKMALQLDPNNEAVKENIRMAEQKLIEQQQRSRSHQNTSSFSFSSSNGSASEHHNQSTGGSRSQGAPPPFGSMPFNTGSGTADFANMFMNMAGNAYQGQHSQDSQGDHHSSNGNGDDEPEIRVDGNVNVDFGEMPAELSGALRSVMQMLSGVASNGNAHDTPNEGPTRPN